jgi:hypothetical protein
MTAARRPARFETVNPTGKGRRAGERGACMDRGLPDEIKSVRDRLAEIENERLTLGVSDFERRADLLDEEHDLEARLANLVAAAASDGEAEKKAAEQTDLTRSPRLPEGEASH